MHPRLPPPRIPLGPTRLLLCLWLALAGLLAGAAGATPSIVPVLPPDGQRNNGLPVLSADGSTVVARTIRTGSTASSSVSGVYLWTRDGGTVDFDALGPEVPDPTRFDPRAISGDGSRIVGTLDGSAVVWERGVGTTTLPFLLPGTSDASAWGISDDGRYVAGSAHDGGTWALFQSAPGGGIVVIEQPRLVPVRWDLETGEVVALSTTRGRAIDVSDDGIAVGELDIEIPGLMDQTAAFRWDSVHGAQYVPIGLDASFFRWAPDVARISADGTTFVGRNLDEPPPGRSSPLIETAYFWQGEPGDGEFLPEAGLTMLDLPVPDVGFAQVTVTGVSGDGSTIVGRYGSAPFIWTRANGYQALAVFLAAAGVPLDRWTLLDVWDVSADGRTFLGRGRFLDSEGRSSTGHWIAVIPEPSTALLLVLGLTLLATSRDMRAPSTAPHRAAFDGAPEA